MLKVAICGFGRIGQIHYDILKDLKDMFEVSFIIDVVDDHAIEEPIFHPDIFIEKVTEYNIDAVYICTPTKYHHDMVCSAIINGLHVFVEKPVSTSEAEVRRMYDLAAKHEKVIFCAFNRRFDPQLMEVRKRYRSGELGHARQGLIVSRDYPYPPKEFLKISGGFYKDCLIHDVDYISWVLGEVPYKVSSHASMVENVAKEVEQYDNSVSTLFFKSDLTVTIMNSRTADTYDQRFELMGSKASLRMTNPVVDTPWSFPERYIDSYVNESKAFYANVVEGTPVSVSLADCLQANAVVEACEFSNIKERPVLVQLPRAAFRDYEEVNESVRTCYYEQRRHQTLDYHAHAIDKYCRFDKEATFWELFDHLKDFVDLSDPDISLSNHQHLYQTAERIRQDGLPEWLQLVGLIHDLGKILYKMGNDADGTSMSTQWGIVGDTFILGCEIPETAVFPEFNLNHGKDKYGNYVPNCGFDQLKCSFGHDEYLYRLLRHNEVELPEAAYYIVRYHSLYLWHHENEYRWFETEKDAEMKWWVGLFQKYDLYTKNPKKVDEVQAKEYYSILVSKFLPERIQW